MSDDKQRSRLWVALPMAIIVGVTNIFLFFLFMVLYGHVIAPGYEESYYQEAASHFGPYASIVGGIPVMFAAGVLLRRFLGHRALRIGIATWCIYLVVDMTVLISLDQFSSFLPHFVVSFATKLLAIYLGARPRANV